MAEIFFGISINWAVDGRIFYLVANPDKPIINLIHVFYKLLGT